MDLQRTENLRQAGDQDAGVPSMLSTYAWRRLCLLSSSNDRITHARNLSWRDKRPILNDQAVARQPYRPVVAANPIKWCRAARHLISAYNLIACGYNWRGIAQTMKTDVSRAKESQQGPAPSGFSGLIGLGTGLHGWPLGSIA